MKPEFMFYCVLLIVPLLSSCESRNQTPSDEQGDVVSTSITLVIVCAPILVLVLIVLATAYKYRKMSIARQMEGQLKAAAKSLGTES